MIARDIESQRQQSPAAENEPKAKEKHQSDRRIYLLVVALILLAVVIGLSVHFGTRKNDKSVKIQASATSNTTIANKTADELTTSMPTTTSTSLATTSGSSTPGTTSAIANTIAPANIMTTSATSATPFAIPSYCQIKNALYKNVTDDYVNNWRANQSSYPEKGYGFVAVLYPDTANRTLKVAVHIRNLADGNNTLGLPGGHVDAQDESLREGTLRELKEEAMSQTSVAKSDLHLIAASRNTAIMQINTLYVLFVDDVAAITGPGSKNEDEMKVDETQGFSNISRHRFVEWEIDSKGFAYLNSKKQGLTSKIWFPTKKSLSQVSQVVKCQFP